MGKGHTYVIAEMACSHEGDPDLARRIIDAAGSAGADAVQFQIWRAEAVMVPHHKDYGLLCRLELSRDRWRELAAHARSRHPDLQIIACVYDADSADFAATLPVDAYKLHSADLSNPSLVSHVAKIGRRIDLSVGSSTVDEISAAVSWIRAASAAPIWLMYGYQNFPTRIDDVHLRYLQKLRELFELPVGYQDHTDADDPAAFWIPAAAVGAGVHILEKHVTHDRSKKGADHQAALNPDEFATFVRMVRNVEQALGSGVPRPFSPDEEKYRRYAKKSLVASRALPEGHQLADEDFQPLRAEALGVPPSDAPRLVGRRTRRAIPQYGLVTDDDLA
jgi:sialic acid synthase SpsE